MIKFTILLKNSTGLEERLLHAGTEVSEGCS